MVEEVERAMAGVNRPEERARCSEPDAAVNTRWCNRSTVRPPWRVIDGERWNVEWRVVER